MNFEHKAEWNMPNKGKIGQTCLFVFPLLFVYFAHFWHNTSHRFSTDICWINVSGASVHVLSNIPWGIWIKGLNYPSCNVIREIFFPLQWERQGFSHYFYNLKSPDWIIEAYAGCWRESSWKILLLCSGYKALTGLNQKLYMLWFKNNEYTVLFKLNLRNEVSCRLQNSLIYFKKFKCVLSTYHCARY